MGFIIFLFLLFILLNVIYKLEFYIRNNITSYDSNHDDNLLNLRKILISNSNYEIFKIKVINW